MQRDCYARRLSLLLALLLASISSIFADSQEQGECLFPKHSFSEFFDPENIAALERRYFSYNADRQWKDVDLSGRDRDRTPSYPFISGDGFRALAAYICEDGLCGPAPKANGSKRLKPVGKHDAVVVYIRSDYIAVFKEKLLPTLKEPFILISHNALGSAPDVCRDVLESPLLRAWFAKNANISHPKLRAIPLGIENRFGKIGKDPEKYFDAMRNSLSTRPTNGVFSSFKVETFPEDRVPCNEIMRRQPYVTVRNKFLPQNEFLKQVLSHKFTAAPRGTGMDTHRLWETLLVGRIPIVRRNFLSATLYKDLPVLALDKWEDLSLNLLDTEYEQIMSGHYVFHKVFFDYWAQYLLHVRRNPKWYEGAEFC